MRALLLSTLLATGSALAADQAPDAARLAAVRALSGTEAKVVRILEGLLNRDAAAKMVIAPDKGLVTDLKMDSLDLAETMMDIEDIFQVQMKQDDPRFRALRTVADLIAHVDALVTEKAAAPAPAGPAKP